MTIANLFRSAMECHRAGRLAEAEGLYRQILTLDAHHAGALNNLANVVKDSGRIEEAVDLCRQALAIEPGNAEIHSSLCYKVHFHPAYGRAELLEELKEWDRAQGRGDEIVQPHENDRSSDRRLKVGYVSPDFYGHAECFFVLPLLRTHDRSRIEVHCYSSVRQPDRATELIRSVADVWHDVLQLSDEQLAERIREDQIDILVDLSMHMAFNRLGVFARKPAPVQVAWLAYPGGTGLRRMDYRLTDRFIDPPAGSDAFYVERSIRLPGCWCCYDPVGEFPPARPRPAGPVTFGSLNNPGKLNDLTLKLWARVLREVKESRLLVLAVAEDHRARIGDLMRSFDVDDGRVEFVGYQTRRDYLRLYDQIDICLDALPYNGITTTCDALWMGVPVVSLIGRTGAGRAGLSILSNIGLAGFAAEDEAHFVRLASELADNEPYRRELRGALRERMRTSPVMNAEQFARDIEQIYRDVWDSWRLNA